MSGICAFPTGTFSVVLAFISGLDVVTFVFFTSGVDCKGFLMIVDGLSGADFADLIACLSIILTNSFHDHPLVFNSAISFTSAPAVAL